MDWFYGTPVSDHLARGRYVMSVTPDSRLEPGPPKYESAARRPASLVTLALLLVLGDVHISRGPASDVLRPGVFSFHFAVHTRSVIRDTVVNTWLNAVKLT